MFNKFKILILLCILLLLTSCSAISISHFKNQGIDFLNDGYYQDALESFDRALLISDGAVGTTQYDILLYKAECYFLLSEYDKANHIYDILLKVDKNNKTYEELYNKSSAYLKIIELRDALNNDEIEKAEVLIDEIKKLGLATDKAVEFNEAVFLEKSGDWEKAREAFADYFIKYSGDKNAERELDFLNTRVTSTRKR
jgi:tetratricopeptide (TPR) repeat protein